MTEAPLDDPRRLLIAETRQRLGELTVLLARGDAPADEQEALARSVEQLDGFFLLVVVGEFNSGKSALINALLGLRLLDEGVTPTTAAVGLIRYGPNGTREPVAPGLERISAPVELLRDVAVVDTPGTNAVLREHETLSRRFVPRSDLVLFVTSADRPFAESERTFLATIREWGKETLIVVNKSDILEGPAELERVAAFVREKAASLLGALPLVFPLSAKLGLRAKLEGDGARLEASGLRALERQLSATLKEAGRFRLKLLNPVGVGEHVLRQAAARVAARLALLREDVTALGEIDGQLALFREDLARDFRFRLADVENLVLDFERRGHSFFSETLRLGRIFELFERERIRDAFERQVVAELPREVERRVGEIVDWMVDSELELWRDVNQRLSQRQAAHAERMVGRLGGFEHDRRQRLEQVRREAHRAVESYDHQTEARRLAGAVRDAVAGGALLQVGAIGLGAAVAGLATTTFADVTGLLAAGTLSVIGMLLLPARRRQARQQLRQQVGRMRETLMERLGEAFDRELQGSIGRIGEALGPYTRFVRGERERLDAQRAEAERLGAELGRLRARIEAIEVQPSRGVAPG